MRSASPSFIDSDILQLRARIESELSSILAGPRSSTFREDDIAGLRQFLGWHRLRYGEDLPLADLPPRVALFLRECSVLQQGETQRGRTDAEERLLAAKLLRQSGPISLVTLQRRVTTLSRVYAFASDDPLRRHPEVKDALRSITAAERRRWAGPTRDECALTERERRRLLSTCDGSSLGVRDRALLQAWFCTGLSLAVLLRLDARSLLDAVGRCQTEACRQPALEAINAWCAWVDLPSGPVFRRIWGTDRIGASLSLDAAKRILRRRSALAALKEPVSP